jgi:hypothetical protein
MAPSAASTAEGAQLLQCNIADLKAAHNHLPLTSTAPSKAPFVSCELFTR